MWLFLILSFITTVITLAIYLPQETRGLIADSKRQLRLWVIRHVGEHVADVFAQHFYQAAVQKGHDPKIVAEVLEEYREIICMRLGTPLANDILGEPSPLERYG